MSSSLSFFFCVSYPSFSLISQHGGSGIGMMWRKKEVTDEEKVHQRRYYFQAKHRSLINNIVSVLRNAYLDFDSQQHGLFCVFQSVE